jgi:hypothetical protein
VIRVVRLGPADTVTLCVPACRLPQDPSPSGWADWYQTLLGWQIVPSDELTDRRQYDDEHPLVRSSAERRALADWWQHAAVVRSSYGGGRAYLWLWEVLQLPLLRARVLCRVCRKPLAKWTPAERLEFVQWPRTPRHRPSMLCAPCCSAGCDQREEAAERARAAQAARQLTARTRQLLQPKALARRRRQVADAARRARYGALYLRNALRPIGGL